MRTFTRNRLILVGTIVALSHLIGLLAISNNAQGDADQILAPDSDKLSVSQTSAAESQTDSPVAVEEEEKKAVEEEEKKADEEEKKAVEEEKKADEEEEKSDVSSGDKAEASSADKGESSQADKEGSTADKDDSSSKSPQSPATAELACAAAKNCDECTALPNCNFCTNFQNGNTTLPWDFPGVCTDKACDKVVFGTMEITDPKEHGIPDEKSFDKNSERARAGMDFPPLKFGKPLAMSAKAVDRANCKTVNQAVFPQSAIKYNTCESCVASGEGSEWCHYSGQLDRYVTEGETCGQCLKLSPGGGRKMLTFAQKTIGECSAATPKKSAPVISIVAAFLVGIGSLGLF